jgi:hypothetical protein
VVFALAFNYIIIIIIFCYSKMWDALALASDTGAGALHNILCKSCLSFLGALLRSGAALSVPR